MEFNKETMLSHLSFTQVQSIYVSSGYVNKNVVFHAHLSIYFWMHFPRTVVNNGQNIFKVYFLYEFSFLRRAVIFIKRKNTNRRIKMTCGSSDCLM